MSENTPEPTDKWVSIIPKITAAVVAIAFLITVVVAVVRNEPIPAPPVTITITNPIDSGAPNGGAPQAIPGATQDTVTLTGLGGTNWVYAPASRPNPWSGGQAVAWELAQIQHRTVNVQGLCLGAVTRAYGYSYGFYSAKAQANAYPKSARHAIGDGTGIPAGALIWYTNGEFGHVMLSTGGGGAISNDIHRSGYLDKTSVGEVARLWNGYWPDFWTAPDFMNGAGGRNPDKAPNINPVVAPVGQPVVTITTTVGEQLTPGGTLTRGQQIRSTNGTRAVLQGDGNFVLYNNAGKARWATKVRGSKVAMQNDGNLVLYNGKKAVWASRTSKHGSKLVVQNDQNLVIYGPGGAARWSTHTFVKTKKVDPTPVAATVGVGTAGPDVSSYQGTVNWSQVKAGKINGRVTTFGFTKAVEGTWVDPTFSRNWKQIGAVGLTRGAYDFGTFSRNPKTDAQYFVATVKKAGAIKPTDYLILDAEGTTGGRTQATLRTWIKTWLTETSRLSGLPASHVGVYTGEWWWTPNIGTTAGFTGNPLWLSDYSGKLTATLGAWKPTWVQYTDKAKIAGVGYGDASVRVR